MRDVVYLCIGRATLGGFEKCVEAVATIEIKWKITGFRRGCRRCYDGTPSGCVKKVPRVRWVYTYACVGRVGRGDLERCVKQ